MVGAMFMQVNARCAHQRRPPLEAESSTENDDTSRQVVDRWPTALSPTLFEKRPPKRITLTPHFSELAPEAGLRQPYTRR